MSNFTKTKDFLICVDSDGCAMDTMNYKHIKCFGPLAADEWAIKNREKFLDIWNTVNLFSQTRGVNRFKGLIISISQMREFEDGIDDISQIEQWVKTTKSLSNASLKDEMAAQKGKISAEKYHQLEKAMSWSLKVNEMIHSLTGEDKPFPGVLAALQNFSKDVHIAIVSSANRGAIDSEWNRHGLMDYVELVYGQEEGTKSDCIRKILEFGFAKDKVLMVGDSPGDLTAAEDNSVLFFPILFGKEEYSWNEITAVAKPKFLSGQYAGDYNNRMKKEFNNHLSGGTV